MNGGIGKINGYFYQNRLMTIKELSQLSGVSEVNLRYRLRHGYTVEKAIEADAVRDTVTDFCEASDWHDWLGLSTDTVYETYWKWCLRNELPPLDKQTFMMQMLKSHSELKTVPTKRGGTCKRIIRLRRNE